MPYTLSHALRSLGAASHIAALGPDARVETHKDRVVVRMPDLPDYWTGNFVLFRTGTVAPHEQIARFRADFPQADHVALAWDAERFEDRAGLEMLAAEGFDADVEDVLLRSGPVPKVEVPHGVDLRALQGDADWAAATALQTETDIQEDGYDAAAHAAFMKRRMAARRRHVAAGGLCWFGAFKDDQLVADLGIIVAPHLVRFQAVETRASERRRGLATALVAHASRWAAREAPSAPQVMFAEEASDAGRIYRRLGFELIEQHGSAVRGSYERSR